jgi:hypothetical protein
VDFQEADHRYAEIKRRQETGGLTQEEFDEQLKQLMVEDEEGRWWVKSRTTGEWHYHDGERWIKGTPPNYESPESAPQDARQDASAAYVSNWRAPEPFRLGVAVAYIAGITIIVMLLLLLLSAIVS